MELTSGRSPAIIVIVNPKSGAHVASEFLELPAEGLALDEHGLRATVYSYPITHPEKAGFLHLAREVDAAGAGERVRCIVAGGDGTVMWTLDEIFKAGIPVEKVSIGIVPFGTGNDFANATGWSAFSPGRGFLKARQGFEGLRRYARAWLQAEDVSYDIWEVSVRARAGNNNPFEFIENGKKVCTDAHRAQHGIQELPDGGAEMSKYVCNYFSVGYECRVGLGFDKSRRTSQLLNKAVYVREACKKTLFKRTGRMGQLMESMAELRADKPLECASTGHGKEDAPEENVVFATPARSDACGAARLLGNPINLIFLNIPSIAAGLDLWRWSSKRTGTTGAPPELLQAPQDFGDGRLECLSYRSALDFGAEQLRAPPVSGRGQRIYSGKGPLRVNFRDPSDKEYARAVEHCKGRTYMQVDGEYFIVHAPESIVIRHHKVVNVLVNAQQPQCGCW